MCAKINEYDPAIVSINISNLRDLKNAIDDLAWAHIAVRVGLGHGKQRIGKINNKAECY